MANGIPIDWKSIIYRGIESEELDYKSAQNWLKLSRVGKARLARHCMAMANTKGGYIVIGVGEDKSGKPCVYTGLTAQQSKSFDPTDVGNVINRYSDPPVDFDIERPVIDGKRYVIFVIRRFSLLPHVCCYNCDNELQQGVFYVRTADASSRPAYKSSEVHAIVQRALRNQREVLGRMLRGILYEGKKTIDVNSKSEFVEQMVHSRKIFDRTKTSLKAEHGMFCEISVFPSEFIQEKFGLSQIKKAVENSVLTSLDSSFLIMANSDECYFTNVAYRSFSKEKKQFWQAFSSGLFHYMTFLEKNHNSINYLEIIKLVSEAVHFLGQYYYELGYTDELFNIRFKISDTEGVILEGMWKDKNAASDNSYYICRIPEIEVKMFRTAADLISGNADHSARIIKEICERFNLPEGKHQKLENTILSLLEKRGT